MAATPYSWLTRDREATALASRVLLVLNANLYCDYGAQRSRFFSQCAQRFQDAAADCAMFSRAGVTALHTAGLPQSARVERYNYYIII